MELFSPVLQVAQYRRAWVRGEVQPGEIGLTAAQTQLVQTAQLVLDDELLHRRVRAAVVQHLDQPVVAVHNTQIVFQLFPFVHDDLQRFSQMLFFGCPFLRRKRSRFHKEIYLRIFDRMQRSPFMGGSQPRPAGRKPRWIGMRAALSGKKRCKGSPGNEKRPPSLAGAVFRQTCGDAEVFSFSQQRDK